MLGMTTIKVKLIIVLLICSVLKIQSQSLEGSIQVNGTKRTFRYFLPKDYISLQSIPLVINYHGTGTNASFQETYSEYNKIADTSGFTVCYPNANGIAFDLIADVRFTEELLDYFKINHKLDQCRIYGTGFSNGGFFAQQLSCKLANKFAAIASVSGTMTKSLKERCDKAKSMPMMHIHGTADGIVNYAGGSSPFLSYISVDELMSFWKLRNQCSDGIEVTSLNNLDLNDGTTTDQYQNNSCKNATILLKVMNGGHTWPGSPINIGITSKDFNASEVTWLFFKDKVLTPECTTTMIDEVESGIIVEYLYGVLSISSKENCIISIIDVQGRVVYQERHNGSESIHTDLSGLKGFFIVRVAVKDKFITKKIMVF